MRTEFVPEPELQQERAALGWEGIGLEWEAAVEPLPSASAEAIPSEPVRGLRFQWV